MPGRRGSSLAADPSDGELESSRPAPAQAIPWSRADRPDPRGAFVEFNEGGRSLIGLAVLPLPPQEDHDAGELRVSLELRRAFFGAVAQHEGVVVEELVDPVHVA